MSLLAASVGCGGGDPASTDVSRAQEGEAAFEPKPHEDSGGGVARLRGKDGDKKILAFGQEADGGEFEQAAAALHNFMDAAAGGHWEAACDYMAAWVVEGFEQLAANDEELEGCAATLERFASAGPGPSPGAEAKQADVVSVRVDGNRAFAIYRGRGKSPRAIEMVKEGDAWKVAGLSGRPLG